jgi:hypothetical protein
MSVIATGTVRCDWCGKLSRHQYGEYVRKDGAAGYIRAPDWDKSGKKDVCDDCVGDGTEQCTVCGAGNHLNPDCKACNSARGVKQRISDSLNLDLMFGPRVNDGPYWR